MSILLGDENSNIASLEILEEEEQMCDITIESDEHLFYANGIVVHNSQEELVVAGMLAREPVIVNSFETGGDLHTNTATQMYPGERIMKIHRRYAKIANFGLLYLGNAWTIMNSSGLPKSQCEDIYNRYWQTMKVLARWIKQQIALTYQRGGVCRTAFGRPRRLAFYLGSGDKKMKKFGERSVVSHIVQGTCGDVMRIALSRLWKEVFSIYTEDVKFATSVHDEVDFCVRKEHFLEIVPKFIPIMEMGVPGCKLPLKVEVSVGTSLGNIFPFVLKEGKWTPKFEDVS